MPGFKHCGRLSKVTSWLVAASLLTGIALSWNAGTLLSAAEQTEEKQAKELPAAVDRQVDYVRDVQPLLAARCFSCHGPDEQEAGLRLDRKFAIKGDSGFAVVPGKSEQSLVVQLTAGHDPERLMPPEGKRLTAEEIGLLRAWIDQGAQFPAGNDQDDEYLSLWSLQPLAEVAVPTPDDPDSWIQNPIDAFVLRQLRDKQMTPSPPADRTTLIRRLSLDLLGLPPTPAEVDAFVGDTRPDALPRLVDRLLDSGHFGERWGRHWLDMARYADSDGYEKDRPRPNAWRWRNWVIDAINHDMPFDQFTIEQLAGDLLPDATPDQILATAFHRQTLTNTEGGTDKEQFRVEAIFDRVATTGAVWLGLTVGCAQCHSHKYDRISQAEYYQLFAFFNNGDEADTDIAISEQAVADYRTALKAHQEKTAGVREQLAARRAAVTAEQTALEAALRKELDAVSGTSVEFLALAPAEAKSKGGLKLTTAEDASVLVSGKSVPTDTYTVLLQIPETAQDGQPVPVTGLRLEALPDPSLGANGPGRTPHGNFVLTRISAVSAADQALKEGKQSVTLTAPTASHSQDKFGPEGSLDPNAKTGWAVAPHFGKPHEAVYRIPSAVSLKPGAWLQVTLEQNYGTAHLLGRFRLSLRTGRDVNDVAPEEIRQLLAIEPGTRTPAQSTKLVDFLLERDSAGHQLQQQLAALEKAAPEEPLMKVRVILERKQNPRQTHILRRGDFLQPQAEVAPGTLSILHDFPTGAETEQPNRLDLARWLVSPDNPLTPRVVANRIWSHLFGQGLVTTLNDFGIRGEQPTHPELLDWLARDFIRNGWSRKALIRRIVLSSTYQQASVHRPEYVETDPQNRQLHRQNRFRVEAEIIRDLSLAASGLLSDKIGGPSVFPPMAADVAALSYAGNFRWQTSSGPDRYRRGLYTFFKRTSPYPNLVTFDCPDANTTAISRMISNTPLQALTTLNNTVFLDAARSLGQRVEQFRENADSAAVDDAARLTYAFRLCVARAPEAADLARLEQLLQISRKWYAEHPADAAKLLGTADAGNSSAEQQRSTAETAAWVATARVLLNLDEFLTRE